MEVFITILEKYGVEAFVLLLTIAAICFSLKKFLDMNMMSEFDKLFIPKINSEWNQIMWAIAFVIISNALLTVYALIAVEQIQALVPIITQVLSYIFGITLIILMLNLFFIFVLKDILLFLKIDTLVFYVINKITKLFKKANHDLELLLKIKAKKIARGFYSFTFFVNVASLIILYVFLVPGYYKGISLLTFNINTLIELFVRFSVSTAFLLIIFFLYGWLSKFVSSKKPKLANYIMKRIDRSELSDNKIHFFYMLDDKTMVLGNQKSFEESTLIYLYDKTQDSYLEFSRLIDH